MTFAGTVDSLNTALSWISYTPSPGFTGDATLTVTTNDLGFTGITGSKSDTDTVVISVQSFEYTSAPNYSTLPAARDMSFGTDGTLVINASEGC